MDLQQPFIKSSKFHLVKWKQATQYRHIRCADLFAFQYIRRDL